MVAATVFFSLSAIGQRQSVSLTVAGLVTLIAAIHYFYMRDVWALSESPTVYVDWLTTVPLQIIVLPDPRCHRHCASRALLAASGRLRGDADRRISGRGRSHGRHARLHHRMVVAGIIYEVFSVASRINPNAASQRAFSTLQLIVTVGWSIYPVGYVLGYMTGTVDAAALNLTYNLADLVNKIAFGVAIWVAATSDDRVDGLADATRPQGA